MFEQLALVDHPNIVKLHKYWLDASEARARVSYSAEWGRGVASVWVEQLRGPTRSGGAVSPPAPQVIFITEYVSSGSLKQFLKKTKKNHKAMNARVGGVGWGQGREGGLWERDGTGHRSAPERGGAAGGLRRPCHFSCAHPTGVLRPLPGLEEMVHADPVRAQVRT